MGSTDLGIKMSLPGFDVATVPDANVYFSSSWPWLKIQDTQKITLDTSLVSIPHSLKYPPFSLVWSSRYGFKPDLLTINSNRITISGVAGDIVRYYIFRLPLNKSYTSPTLLTVPDPQLTVDHDHGIKFSKPGKDITSTDYRDFTIHSGTRSPLLHKVLYAKCAPIVGGDYATGNGLEWINDLPYLPVYFPFFSTDNENFHILSSIAQTPPKINFDGLDAHTVRGIVINDLGSIGHVASWGSFVILKDPFNSSSVTTVTL